MLYHQFIDVFVGERQSALTDFYFHYSENFFVPIIVRSQYCSTDIPVSQIQPQITGDPVVAGVFLKVS